MLCQNVILYKLAGVDEDRNPSYNEGVNLENVYITYNDAQTKGGNGFEPSSRASLFYDVFNSMPHGIIFAKGDKIEVDNLSFTIQEIRPLYNKNGLHHYEIELL